MNIRVNKRKPFTPGEILREEFMEPSDLTQHRLADLISVSRRTVNEIVNGKRAITPDTALRLAKLFNVTPEYWLNLQNKVDLWEVMDKRKKEIKKIKPFDEAA